MSDTQPATRPMRIAWVVSTFNMGGLERCVARLANGLDRERFQPFVICLHESGAAADWIDRGDVEIVELHKRPGNDWRIIGRLAHALRERQVDLVQSHNWGTLVETTLARKRARTPIHVHAERGTVLGTVDGGGFRYRLRALTMRWALRRADAVMSNAVSVAKRVEQTCGFPANRFRIIPNGVERPAVADAAVARRELRKELKIPESAFVAGSVGRLHPVKGFNIAIEAIQRLLQNGEDVYLILVGDGPEEDRLRELAQSLQIGKRVHFAGRRHDIGRWLAAMDVFLNTSHSEGMSQSLVEAMAAGLPLVVTDVGDNRITIGDEQICSLVSTSFDPNAIAALIARIAGDQHLRTTLARESQRRFMQHFQLQNMFLRFESTYLTLAAGSTQLTHTGKENR